MDVHGVELMEEGDMVCLSHKGQPFEPDSFAIWCALARPGAVMIDVGAYSGLYAIAAAKRGARVYAFEPNSECFQRMLMNISNNDVQAQITASNQAVMDSPGRFSLNTHNRPRLTSAGHVEADPNGDIEATTLDSLGLLHVAAIKMDIEGAELAALAGAVKLLTECKPVLILESLGDVSPLDNYLAGFGYGPGLRIDSRNVVYGYAQATQ